MEPPLNPALIYGAPRRVFSETLFWLTRGWHYRQAAFASRLAGDFRAVLLTHDFISAERLGTSEELQGLDARALAMFWNHRVAIINAAAAARLPTVYPEREYATDGGLAAYGANLPDGFRRAATYVDRKART